MTLAAEQQEQVATELAPLAERLSDRLNPILVKEVRQSLRGRYFKVSFWVTLTLATMIGLGVLLVSFSSTREGASAVYGPQFFVAIFACLALATQVLVPFSAFLSMGSEWDENTFDLLVLSNLKPRQIVIGKVQSAAVQALLFYASFGPFLVFAFLLRGLDLLAIFLCLGISFVGSLLLSCLAVALSSFGQGRFARLMLMVLLAIVLVQGTFVTIAWAGQTMMIPSLLRDPDMLQGLAAAASIAAAVAAFFFAAACARLAHPEENRSTGLRVMTLVGIAVGLAWATIIDGWSVDEDVVLGAVMVGHAVLALATLFFITEPERLGRRVAAKLPKSRLVRLLATPLLPGGARGLVFFVCGSLMMSAWALGYSFIAEGRLVFTTGELDALVALPLYGVIFLGIPSALFTKRLDSLAVRGISRIVIVTGFIAAIMLPALIGFLFGLPNWADFEHPLNVFTMIHQMLRKDGHYEEARYFLVAGTLICVALNWPRLVRAAREQLQAPTAASSDA
ncbi:MAG: hypothetical protein H6831_01130 [Planctomycetes bacterium]|nr:hypothetical protein [Planctomycetota bacterium]MCB9902988.1 hypothetical protein [Planctomycetota bacterium]